MTQLDLRCTNSLHARFDPERNEVEVKCPQCSKQLGRPQFHRWRIPDLIDAYKRGEVSGVVGPSDPRFVHWKIAGS